MAADPERRVLPLNSLTDAIEAARRTHERKRAFRQSIGWLTREELMAHGARPDGLEALHAEVQRLVRADASGEVVQ